METGAKVPTATDTMRHYRERLRRQGLRAVQVWVPDCRAPAFRSALKRQVAKLDRADEAEVLAFMDAAGANADRASPKNANSSALLWWPPTGYKTDHFNPLKD